MPDLHPFEQALAEAAAGLPPEEAAPPSALEHFLEAHRGRLSEVHTLGDPARAGDIYAALDAVASDMKTLHPGSLCRRGCSGCCETPTAVFEASAREWDAIERHLASWDEPRRRRLWQRFEATHRHHLGAYRLLRWLGHFEPLAAWYFRRHGYVCPFLDEGACGIYPARPVACRMYGHFATRAPWKRRRGIYGCRLQADYHESRLRDGRPQLPDAEAVWSRAGALTREPFWRWKRRPRLLPEWIAVRLAPGVRDATQTVSVADAGSEAP
jgi:Fe-S-cluster containining protein